MLNKYISALLLSILILNSCKKDLKVKDVDFDVSIDKADFKTAEQLRFNFKGNADIITFYSGLPGGRYEFHGRTSADGTPVLSFSSAKNAGAQSNSLNLLVSTDFKGMDKDNNQTIANISAASWKDLTSKVTLASGTAATPSGELNLTEIANENKPVYLAFKYLAQKGSIQNKWTINNLVISNKLADGTVYTIANLNANATEIINYGAITYSPGWISSMPKGKVNWVITAGTSLVITGAATAATATDDAEAWVVMGPLNLKKVSPDLGLPIKKQTEDMSAFPYLFNYTVAGTFQPTFVGMNSSRDAQSVKVKTFVIKVQ